MNRFCLLLILLGVLSCASCFALDADNGVAPGTGTSSVRPNPVMMECGDGVAFRVDDVEQDSIRYATMRYPFAIKHLFSHNDSLAYLWSKRKSQAQRIKRGDTTDIDSSLFTVRYDPWPYERGVETQNVLFYPETQMRERLVGIGVNGFLQTVHTSYAEHKPLTLSPDEVWLVICQGLAIHINEHMDSLKKVLYKPKYVKPQTVSVRNDFLNDGYVYWEDLIDSMANATRRFTNVDLYSQVVQSFSTTTQVEKTALQITLMDSHHDHISYVAETGCGIPYIHLRGTTEDWRKIKSSLDNLKTYGMADWANTLKPVVEEFVQASQGNPNIAFWKSIYKTTDYYMASHVSGWILKFFPYLYSCSKEKLLYNPYLAGHDYLLSNVDFSQFPSGLSMAPVTWINYQIVENVFLCSGFVGMRQHRDGSLEPAISWFVCKDDVASPHIFPDLNNDCLMKWFGGVYGNNKVEKKARYDSTVFSTPEMGYDYVKSEVNFFLKKKMFKEVGAKDTLTVLLLMDGTVSKAYLNRNDDKLNAAVDVFVKKLRGPWSPAMRPLDRVFDEPIDSERIKFYSARNLDNSVDENRKRVITLDELFPVNCVIKIPLK